jgi:hypothetical protein
MALFHVEFDATGFSRNSTRADGELSRAFILAFNARHAGARTFPRGVVNLVRGQVSHERVLAKSGTRGFVSIVLAIEAASEEAAERFFPPSEFLKPLFDALGNNTASETLLCFDRGWEVIAIEALEAEMA